jgi:hypothetical protein
MRKLWRCIQTHKRAAVLFLVYWLATLAVTVITWDKGIPTPVVGLLFTTPLIAGVLVGRWRTAKPERAACSGDRIRGGMLAGALSGGITILVMPGGVVAGVISWIQGARIDGWDEVLEFLIFFVVIGALLGLIGAVLAIILGRFRHHGRPIRSA